MLNFLSFVAFMSKMFFAVVFGLAMLSAVQGGNGSDFVSRAEFEERLKALEDKKIQSMYTLFQWF